MQAQSDASMEKSRRDRLSKDTMFVPCAPLPGLEKIGPEIIAREVWYRACYTVVYGFPYRQASEIAQTNVKHESQTNTRTSKQTKLLN